MVRPEILTLGVPEILKMRKFDVPAAALRCTLRRLAPGPLMVRFLLMGNSPLVRSMAPRTLAANVIVLPPHALARIERNEPAPLSPLLFTTRFVSLQPTNWSVWSS